MANFNRVILIGNLTRDPQLRYTQSQAAVCDFGIAVNRQWTGKDGQRREEVTFVNCTAWARQAEIIQKYLTKGRPIFIEGRLTYSQWDGPDGKKRSKLEVTVENFQFLGGGGGGGGGRGDAGAPSRDAGAPSRDAGAPSRDAGAPSRDAGAPSRDAQRQDTSGPKSGSLRDEQEQQAPEYDYNQDVEDDTIPF